MPFTKYFGAVPYSSAGMGNILIPDLTHFFKIPDKFKKDPAFYMQYRIKDGERLDQISKRIYGAEERLYLIILMNDMFDLSTMWPLNDQEMTAMFKVRYPFDDLDDIHHYEDANGLTVDPYAIARTNNDAVYNVISIMELSPVTIEKYETVRNEAKRNIIILDPDVIGEVETEIARLYKDVRTF